MNWEPAVCLAEKNGRLKEQWETMIAGELFQMMNRWKEIRNLI